MRSKRKTTCNQRVEAKTCLKQTSTHRKLIYLIFVLVLALVLLLVLLLTALQAPQIASAYLDDSEAVAAAKEIFSAAFAEAESGGLAAKQQPAPEHVVQEVNRELKQHITSPTITSPSIHHHFLCLFVYLRFVTGIVLLSTNLG